MSHERRARALRALLLAALLLPACGRNRGERTQERLEFPLSCPSRGQKLPEGTGPLRIAVPMYLNPADMKAQFGRIASHLTGTIGAIAEFHYVETYDEAIEALASGEVSFGVLPSYAYVLGKERIPDLFLMASLVAEGGTHFKGYIIANASSGVKGLADLKGKPFAFIEVRSTSGHLLARHLLARAGIEPDTHFSKILWAGTHDRCIEWVLSGEVAAGAVYSGALQHAARQGLDLSQLILLARTEPIPYDAWVARSDVSQDVREALTNSLLQLSTATPEGRGVLGRARAINGWVPGDDRDYEGVRRVHKWYRGQQLKQREQDG